MSRPHLEAALKAAKRDLDFLDGLIREASEVDGALMDLSADPDNVMPYWLPAIDAVDGKHGIALTPTTQGGVNRPAYGVIKNESDAAFVLTRMFACVRFDLDESSLLSLTDSYFSAPQADQLAGFGVRLTDMASGRGIGMLRGQDGTEGSVMIPLTLFGQSYFSSLGGIELPAECTFPRNSAIRVEAFYTANLTISTACRLELVFHGRKVFGG